MGSSFDYRVYKTDNKKEIQSLWIDDKDEVEQDYPHDYISDNYDEDDEDFDYDTAYQEAVDDLGYTGQINTMEDNINWVSIDPFDNLNCAVDYIEENHEKWNNPLGVPFKDGYKINYAVGGWCSD
jgi:hypothetical protein